MTDQRPNDMLEATRDAFGPAQDTLTRTIRELMLLRGYGAPGDPGWEALTEAIHAVRAARRATRDALADTIEGLMRAE